MKEKMSLIMSLKNSHFQNITKMPLHCLYVGALQDAKKNVSTVLGHFIFKSFSNYLLIFEACFKGSQKYASITYIEAT
jgi:hypothetical protein